MAAKRFLSSEHGCLAAVTETFSSQVSSCLCTLYGGGAATLEEEEVIYLNTDPKLWSKLT